MTPPISPPVTGTPSSITANDDLEIIQTWNAGKFQEITLKHWVETAPKYLITNNFAGVPETTVEAIQKA